MKLMVCRSVGSPPAGGSQAVGRAFETTYNLFSEQPALCQPLDSNMLDVYTISKRITQKAIDTNFPEIASPQAYAEVTD